MRLTAAMKIEKNTEQYYLEHLSFSHGSTFLWNGGTILSFNISEHKQFIWNIQKLILHHACKMSAYRCCRNQSGYGILVLHDFGMRVKCRHIHLLDIDNFSTKLAACCCGYWLRLQPVLEPWFCEAGGLEVTFIWHVSYIYSISTTKWKFQLNHIRKEKSFFVCINHTSHTKQINFRQTKTNKSWPNFGTTIQHKIFSSTFSNKTQGKL